MCSSFSSRFLHSILTLGTLFNSVNMEYRSGVEPRETWSSDYCYDRCGNPIPYWHWSLLPHASVTSVFSTYRPFYAPYAPYQGFGGGLTINCLGASVAMDVATNAPSSRHTVTLGSAHRNTLRHWPFPADFRSLSITFRRLDTTSCTVDLLWDSPGLTTDQVFNIKNHIR
jgi:hypothetical protein